MLQIPLFELIVLNGCFLTEVSTVDSHEHYISTVVLQRL